MRVLDIYGVLIFKWNEEQIKLKEILSIIGYQPLFGNKRNKTVSFYQRKEFGGMRMYTGKNDYYEVKRMREQWGEFRNSGLLWFVNMVLNPFGWVICLLVNENDEVIGAYPSRVGALKYDEKCISNGCMKVRKYMKDNASKLLKEAESVNKED